MFIRNMFNPNIFVGGLPISNKQSHPNLYPTAYPFSVAQQGNPYPVAFVTLHGYNAAVSTATDLWPQNTVRTLPTAGFTIGVSSSSASDTAAGTGARTVQVDFLDINFVPYTITVTLNGQTLVSDTTQVTKAFRINDIRVVTTGTGNTNAGDIYVYDNTDTVTAGVPQTPAKIFHKVVLGETVGRGGFYTVPAGCSMEIYALRVGIDDTTTTARAVNVKANTFANTPLSLTTHVPVYLPVGGQMTFQAIQEIYQLPVVVSQYTDITFNVTASAASVISGFADAVLYYN